MIFFVIYWRWNRKWWSYQNLLNFIKNKEIGENEDILKPLSEKCLKSFSQIGFNIYIHRFQFFSFFAKIIWWHLIAISSKSHKNWGKCFQRLHIISLCGNSSKCSINRKWCLWRMQPLPLVRSVARARY